MVPCSQYHTNLLKSTLRDVNQIKVYVNEIDSLCIAYEANVHSKRDLD